MNYKKSKNTNQSQKRYKLKNNLIILSDTCFKNYFKYFLKKDCKKEDKCFNLIFIKLKQRKSLMYINYKKSKNTNQSQKGYKLENNLIILCDSIKKDCKKEDKCFNLIFIKLKQQKNKCLIIIKN